MPCGRGEAYSSVGLMGCGLSTSLGASGAKTQMQNPIYAFPREWQRVVPDRSVCSGSIHAQDAAQRQRPDRSVRPEEREQRVGVVAAILQPRALFDDRKAVATDCEVIVEGDAVPASGFDRSAVERHLLVDHALAEWLRRIPGVTEPVRDLENPRPLRIEPLLLQHVLELAARERHGDEPVAKRLAGENVAEGDRAVLLWNDVGADAAGIGERDDGTAILGVPGRGELRVRNDVAERAFAGLVRHA